jgi:agmatine/peptidylarginine deiminase
MMRKLLPEWSPQEAILFAWPDEKTDWRPWLNDVQNTYLSLIKKITKNQTFVVLLVREQQLTAIKTRLIEKELQGVLLVCADYNDTWLRDYGFLTCSDGKCLYLINYTFNGWGKKFDASKDNQINESVLSPLLNESLRTYDLVIEGGALEINDEGHLLSTEFCLSNPKRNGLMTFADYERAFKEQLGASQVSILRHGHLEGDDTDGHIDTLVRFTPDNGLVVQSAFNRPNDSHFKGLRALVDEVRSLFPHHDIFELPLPLVHNQEGERLPASYANFLITNGLVLAPIYQQPEDNQALDVLRKAFPSHKIEPVDSLPLIQQFGSIHCISMQIPRGTLKPSVLSA